MHLPDAPLPRVQEAALRHALAGLPALQRLVYSTCSVHERENECVVQAVLPLATQLGFVLRVRAAQLRSWVAMLESRASCCGCTQRSAAQQIWCYVLQRLMHLLYAAVWETPRDAGGRLRPVQLGVASQQ